MDIPYPLEGSYIFFFFFSLPFHSRSPRHPPDFFSRYCQWNCDDTNTPPRRRLILELVGFFLEHHRAKHVLCDSVWRGEMIAHWHSNYFVPTSNLSTTYPICRVLDFVEQQSPRNKFWVLGSEAHVSMWGDVSNSGRDPDIHGCAGTYLGSGHHPCLTYRARQKCGRWSTLNRVSSACQCLKIIFFIIIIIILTLLKIHKISEIGETSSAYFVHVRQIAGAAHSWSALEF